MEDIEMTAELVELYNNYEESRQMLLGSIKNAKALVSSLDTSIFSVK